MINKIPKPSLLFLIILSTVLNPGLTFFNYVSDMCQFRAMRTPDIGKEHPDQSACGKWKFPKEFMIYSGN